MSASRLVIVADDDDDTRECVAAILGDEGFDVRLARNGRAALDLLAVLGDERCVLLLDLTMPIMSGFEVLRLLERTGRLAALPVIVCSALKGLEQLPPGVRHVIGKPIDLEKLIDAVVEEACPARASEVRLCAGVAPVQEQPVRRLASS
jgi:CheY-like chemotaxis protein